MKIDEEHAMNEQIASKIRMLPRADIVEWLLSRWRDHETMLSDALKRIAELERK